MVHFANISQCFAFFFSLNLTLLPQNEIKSIGKGVQTNFMSNHVRITRKSLCLPFACSNNKTRKKTALLFTG